MVLGNLDLPHTNLRNRDFSSSVNSSKTCHSHLKTWQLESLQVATDFSRSTEISRLPQTWIIKLKHQFLCKYFKEIFHTKLKNFNKVFRNFKQSYHSFQFVTSEERQKRQRNYFWYSAPNFVYCCVILMKSVSSVG